MAWLLQTHVIGNRNRGVRARFFLLPLACCGCRAGDWYRALLNWRQGKQTGAKGDDGIVRADGVLRG